MTFQVVLVWFFLLAYSILQGRMFPLLISWGGKWGINQVPVEILTCLSTEPPCPLCWTGSGSLSVPGGVIDEKQPLEMNPTERLHGLIWDPLCLEEVAPSTPAPDTGNVPEAWTPLILQALFCCGWTRKHIGHPSAASRDGLRVFPGWIERFPKGSPPS